MKFNRQHGVLLGSIVLFGYFLYLVEKPYTQANRNRSCQSNLKQIGLGMMQYVRDYDEVFPRHNNWTDALRPYMGLSRTPKTSRYWHFFDCPQENTGYALNRFYAGLSASYDRSPEKSSLIYDSTSEKLNASDYGGSWPLQPTHKTGSLEGNNLLFADGHVKLMSRKPVFKAF